MPEFSPVAPRQMFPPPTTTATSVPSSWRASASSMAMRSTTELSMVSSDAALANASPESLRTTLLHGFAVVVIARRGPNPGSSPAPRPREGCADWRRVLPAPYCAPRSAPDDHLCEAHDLGAAEDLLHRLLVVLGEGLLEQHPLLVPAVEHALDDLGQGRLGLARVAGLVLER